VPLIEEGIIENDIMDLTIRHYMDDFILENRIDTVVLGCTHYPLIRSNIERRYPDIRIIDPSEEIVSSIENTLKKKGNDGRIPGNRKYFLCQRSVGEFRKDDPADIHAFGCQCRIQKPGPGRSIAYG